VAAVQGKIGEGERLIRESAKVNEDRGAPDQYVDLMMRMAQVQLRLRGAAAANATANAALAKHPLESIPATDRPYTSVAMTQAMTGHSDEARKLMAEYARVVPAGIVANDPDRLAVAGYIAMSDGHWADAVPAFQAARVENQCALCYLFEIAQSYDKLGQSDSARAYLERFISTGGIYRVYIDALYRALTFQRLGELAEARGDKKAAVEYYEKLIDLWKNADPELQPIVKDARARVTRLTSEH